MKKNYFLTLFFTLFSFHLFSQTIVSTSPENKKAIVSKFAINPNDYYPSGTLNFSQFMKQFIKLTTVDHSLFESDELIFNGYYVYIHVPDFRDFA